MRVIGQNPISMPYDASLTARPANTMKMAKLPMVARKILQIRKNLTRFDASPSARYTGNIMRPVTLDHTKQKKPTKATANALTT